VHGPASGIRIIGARRNKSRTLPGHIPATPGGALGAWFACSSGSAHAAASTWHARVLPLPAELVAWAPLRPRYMGDKSTSLLYEY